MLHADFAARRADSEFWAFPAGIIDRTGKSPTSKRIRMRDLSTVYALVLHQTAFSRGNRQDRYDRVTAHFVILPDGSILQLHPEAAYLYASNGFNRGSVAVEFVGNFPDTRGRWWQGDKFGRNRPTRAQIDAGRRLILYLIGRIGLTHVLAHRQSSRTRANDPGPDIWKGVGQWAVDTLGLKDGGAGFSVGTGQPIPDAWRTWTPRLSEAAEAAAERRENPGDEASVAGCITPGDPYVLHCFRAFDTRPTPEHLTHLDLIAEKIRRSQAGTRPIRRVDLVGHSSTWHATSAAKLEQRAIERAGRVAEALRARLDALGVPQHLVALGFDGRSDHEKWLGKPYSSTSGSSAAQRDRALNRRVEIFLRRAGPRPKPAPPEPEAPKPLTRDEMRDAVFFLLNKRPSNDALEHLFRDLIKMVPTFAKIVRSSGGFPWAVAARVWIEAYIAMLREIFGRDVKEDFWMLVGSAYAAVDVSPRSTELKSLKGVEIDPALRDPMKFRKAFRTGYRRFRRVQTEMAKDEMGRVALGHLRDRIAATRNKRMLLRGAFAAFREIYLSENPSRNEIETYGIPRFDYPKINIRASLF